MGHKEGGTTLVSEAVSSNALRIGVYMDLRGRAEATYGAGLEFQGLDVSSGWAAVVALLYGDPRGSVIFDLRRNREIRRIPGPMVDFDVMLQ